LSGQDIPTRNEAGRDYVWGFPMIAILVVVFALLCLALLRRYQSREHKHELLSMKRHAATYMEQHKRL